MAVTKGRGDAAAPEVCFGTPETGAERLRKAAVSVEAFKRTTFGTPTADKSPKAGLPEIRTSEPGTVQ